MIKIIKTDKEMLGKIVKSTNTTNGGALIPIGISKVLMKELEAYAPVFKFGSKFNAKGNKAILPLEKTGNNIVSWKEEGKAPTEPTLIMQEVEFTKGTLQGHLTTSRELERDSEFNIADIVFSRASRDIGVQIAKDTLIGTGHIKGVLKENSLVSRVINQATQDTITYNEMLELITSTNPAYWEDSKILVSLEYYKKLKQLKNNAGTQAMNGKYFDNLYEVIACTELDDQEYPVIFANWGQLYEYFANEQFETEEVLNRVENTSDKILRLAIGGRILDSRAGTVYKKLKGVK